MRFLEFIITIRHFPFRRRGMAFQLLKAICSTDEFAKQALRARCHTHELSPSKKAAMAATAAADALLRVLGRDDWQLTREEEGETGEVEQCRE